MTKNTFARLQQRKPNVWSPRTKFKCQEVCMPSLQYSVLSLPDMSDKKSPPRKEKTLFVRTPQSDSKTLKRKLLATESSPCEDEETKATPKRKKPLNSEPSPTPSNAPPNPKNPSGITSPRTGPLSERQQMLFLMRLTDETSQDSTSKPTSPQPVSQIGPKRTPGDKKVHKRNERGETPLHLAAIKGDIKQTKKLIKAGADVNVADFAGWTALHEACNRGFLPIAKQLLKAGANVNVQGLENDTPLHDAACNGHGKLVELLLKHGANPLQPNLQGKTPMDVAATPDMVKLLRKEIITSSSDSSSLDDARSPTSPESNSSLKDEDNRNTDSDDYLSRLPKQDGSSNQAALSSRRSLMAKSEKMSSPRRLFLKFQREQADEFHDKPSKEPHFTSYSVTMGPSEHKDFLSVDSPVSSVDSDLYDPQLDSVRTLEKVGVNLMDTEDGLESSALARDRIGLSGERLAHAAALGADRLGHVGIGTDRRAGHSRHIGLGEDRIGLGGLTGHGGLNVGEGMGLISGQGNMSGSRVVEDHTPLTSVISGSKTKVTSSSSVELELRLGMGEFERLSNLEPDGQNVESIVNPAPPPPTKFHQKMMDTQPFSPHFSDNEQSDSELKDPPPLSISSMSSSLSSSLTSSLVTLSQSGRRGSVGDQSTHIPHSSDSNNRTKLKESVSDPGPGNGVGHKSLVNTTTTTNSVVSTSNTNPVTSSSSALSSLFTTVVDKNISELTNSQSVVVPVVSSSSERLGMERTAPVTTSTVSFPRRNSVSSGMVVSSINGSQDSGSGHNIGAGSGSSDPPASSSGLKWELRSSSSSSSSPKNIDEWGNFLSSSKSEGRQSPTKSEKDQDNNSPKSDKDGRESYSRPTSPKVPPLKIIIPPKASTSTANLESVFVKSHSSKHALPYVINPTQEQEAAAKSSQMNQPIPMTTLPQELTNPSTSSPASSRPSSRDSNTASKDNDKQSAQKDSNKEDKVSVLENCKQSVSVDFSEENPQPPCLLTDKEKDQEKDKDSNSVKSGSGKESEKEKEKVEEEKESTQRSTRTLRSHTQAALQQKQSHEKHHKGEKQEKGDKQEKQGNNDTLQKEETTTGVSKNNKEEEENLDIHPRKRKLRSKIDTNAVAQPAPPEPPPPVQLPLVSYEKPPNPFELYLSIRKQVAMKHKQWSVVQPNAPKGFKDYLMVSCSYVLQGNNASTLSVPMLSPPNSVTGTMRDLFVEQEKARYKLRLQHLIEREKLTLSVEQEIIREHGRAARAMANQSLPLSMCALLRDEEIYNTIDPEQVEEKEKNVRSRYSGRQFLSWLKDVDDKYEKIKEDLLLRHHHEAESLFAVQKMDWEWKMKEMSLCDHKSAPTIDDLHVPMVQVNDDFELRPT
ncbi:ankyrin repeat domain-containing protein 12-like [Ylistrum balloti]|uniref:ankyrin repeat domain-containing protein 12-like n=1 Tax=Ylistrum balloti TaxID=509963 RepID=UPI002905D6D9|nr:ankyrin repeat domain-containing protein 12-like [Ylistrum balloti]